MNATRLGESLAGKLSKVNGDLFTLTYGALVAQLLQDYEDVSEVNVQLEKMGYNIGVRLVDEFLAKSNIKKCGSFKETISIVAKVAFKMYLGVNVDVVSWNSEMTQCSLILKDNPLEDFVELPEPCTKGPGNTGLNYSNMLCGVMRGGLEAVSVRVKCTFLRDKLHGDEYTEIRMELVEFVEDMAGNDYRE